MVAHGIDGKTGMKRLMLSNHKDWGSGDILQNWKEDHQKQYQFPGSCSCRNLRLIGFDDPAIHELFLMSIRPRHWLMIRGPRNWLMIQKVKFWSLGD